MKASTFPAVIRNNAGGFYIHSHFWQLTAMIKWKKVAELYDEAVK